MKVSHTWALAICLVLGFPLYARGQAQLPGDGTSGLPSIARIGVMDDGQHRLTLSTSVGYGYTEGVLNGADRHHRVPMALSLSYQPLPWLAFGYTQDVRYDRHVGPPDDGESGWIFEPRARLRGGWCFDNGFRLGAEVLVWFPASDSQSGLAAGTSVDMSLLAAFSPEELPFVVAATAGFRLDRSAEGSTNADALSLSDRLSLGVSDSNAVLLGLGLVWRVGPVEILGELSWDLLVGDGSPEVSETPMRFTAGARYWPIELLQLWLMVDTSLMSRPFVAQGEPLVPVEPRVSVVAGVNLRFGFTGEEEPEIEEPLEVSGVVISEDEIGISGATVTMMGSEGLQSTTSDGSGAFQLSTTSRGVLEVSLSAPGYREHTETIDTGVEPIASLRVVLAHALGDLRGQVVSEAGSSLRGATIRVTAGEAETQELESDDEGRFELSELPVGTVSVSAEIYAYREMTVEAQIEDQGVAEITVELERAFPAGQLSGVVRAINGAPLQAAISIQPLDIERTTTAEGDFEFDIPPGRYRIVVSAEGFTSQRRTIRIEENGVTMVNIDLRPVGRRRNRR